MLMCHFRIKEKVCEWKRKKETVSVVRLRDVYLWSDITTLSGSGYSGWWIEDAHFL